MDIDDLKAELAGATENALRLAGELASAVESGDLDFAVGVAVAQRAALHRVRHLKIALKAEVAG